MSIDIRSGYRTALAACVAMALVGAAALADPPQEVGKIVKVVPPAYLRITEKGQVVKLTARDANRVVHAGDAVRCDAGGSIVLVLHERRVTPTPCTTWYEIAYEEPEMPDQEKSPFTPGARPQTPYAQGARPDDSASAQRMYTELAAMNSERRAVPRTARGVLSTTGQGREKIDNAAVPAVTADKNHPSLQKDIKLKVTPGGTSPSPSATPY